MRAAASSSVQQARQILGNRLAELRRDAGLTGRALAAHCDWHASKVSRVENAVTPPSGYRTKPAVSRSVATPLPYVKNRIVARIILTSPVLLTTTLL
jgi:hypothetical protein